MRDLRSRRESYRRGGIDETAVGDTPWPLLEQWLEEADDLLESNAMVLSTVDVEGRPHARTVLLKGLDAEAGPGPAFYTNYDSAKGADLLAEARCALVLLWLPLERQVRMEGVASRLTEGENAAYFADRPRGSQLGAWASPQSQPIADRSELEAAYERVEERFADQPVPLPPHWGGYRVELDRVEFWQGREDRMHDRLRYRRLTEPDAWDLERLAP